MCEETKALDIINGLSSFFVYDHGVDAIIDRLDSIEEKIVALNLREVEKPKPIREEILEIQDDWEPFIRISIFNQDFLAYCDIGSMVSTMPKTVNDSLKLESMVDLLYYHERGNGDISEIQGKVNNIQVCFAKRNAAVDFIILKSTNQGNIVLGRDFLQAMKGFINVGKGQIRLRGRAKGTYLFPRKKKEELIVEQYFQF